jgi:hypothetical protein
MDALETHNLGVQARRQNMDRHDISETAHSPAAMHAMEIARSRQQRLIGNRLSREADVRIGSN